jgi:hypothetical protein
MLQSHPRFRTKLLPGNGTELDGSGEAAFFAQGRINEIFDYCEIDRKSRLLHEFRQRIGKAGAFILSESCTPDGVVTVHRGGARLVPRCRRRVGSLADAQA